jgi:hypothetical protein
MSKEAKKQVWLNNVGEIENITSNTKKYVPPQLQKKKNTHTQNKTKTKLTKQN